MATNGQWQLSAEAAELYERYVARYILGPWAPLLVDVAHVDIGERVLDVACGTGVVARIAAQRVGPGGRVVGVDLNPGMIAVAGSLPTPVGAPIEWLERSAVNLLLPDASFDVVLCQQGLQFFPDKLVALWEMRRVLVHGGRLALSVWNSTGLYNAALGEALARFVGNEAGTKFCASRQVPAKEDLQRLATEAGFCDVEVRVNRLNIHLPHLIGFILDHLAATPIAPFIAATGPEARRQIGASVMKQLQRYADGDGVTYPVTITVPISSMRFFGDIALAIEIDGGCRKMWVSDGFACSPPVDPTFRRLAAGAAALPAVSRFALAQAYPTRPVRIIVPLAPAGTVDIIARLIGQWLSERLGEQFLIENRPGAGTNLGVEAVVRTPPDGYTLLMIDVSAAFNATLYDKLNFNFVRDIAPVANVVRVPNVIAVHPSFPAKTVPEFIAYAKANPGKISMATAGVGSSSHVFGELFKMTAGVDLVAVPYRGGGPALIDMLSRQVHVIFVPTPASIEYVRAGRLRALGVTSTTRVEILPDLPPVAEFVPGYEASSWYGICAPRNTPAEIIERLNKKINTALADPKIKAKLADMAGTALPGSPADFADLIADDTEKWGKVIRAANIKPE